MEIRHGRARDMAAAARAPGGARQREAVAGDEPAARRRALEPRADEGEARLLQHAARSGIVDVAAGDDLDRVGQAEAGRR